MRAVFPFRDFRKLLPLAFDEDLGTGDITSAAAIPARHQSTAVLTVKEEGVIAGLPLISEVFKYKRFQAVFKSCVREGARVRAGTDIFRITAGTRNLLACERILLNFLQRISGIATRAAFLQNLLGSSRTKILDTRKTVPGYRSLDKYAVLAGGACNHRIGLFDRFLIKDNHIRACGSARAAVFKIAAARKNRRTIIEAEVTSLSEAASLFDTPVDWIMFDNMSPGEMRRTAALVRKKAPHILLEASGNMTPQKIQRLSSIGLDYISVGSLTHSVRSLDISLNIKELS